MSLRIPCPRCGSRPSEEFTYGGELRPLEADDPAAEFARIYLRENAAGPRPERWFHSYGCRRWLTVTRDTRTNRVGTP